MIGNDSSDSSKSSKKFSCEKCNYFTARRSQYERHLETIKHKKLHDNEMIENDSSESSKSPKIRYFCFVTILHNKNIIL